MSGRDVPPLLVEESLHFSAVGTAERAKVTSKTPLDDRLEADTAPTHHAVPLNVGAFLNEQVELGQLFLAHPGRAAGAAAGACGALKAR